MKKLFSSLIMILIFNASSLFATTYTWTGSISTQWNDISNWSIPPGMVPGALPTSTDDVVIPSSITGHFWPTLNTTGYCNSITIYGSFDLSDQWLYLYGDFINNGSFNAGTGTVRFLGTTHNIYGSNSFYNIYAGDYSSLLITFHADQTISNDLQLAGTINTDIYNLNGANTLHLFLWSASILEMGGTSYLSSINYYGIDPESTIKFKGSDQNIGNASSTINYGNIIISGSGTKTLIGNINARYITVEAGTFNLGSYGIGYPSPPFTVPTLTLQSGATMIVGNSIPSGHQLNFHSMSTVEFNGNVMQNISTSYDYGNLTFSGTGQKWIPANNTIVNGTLTLYSGYTIDGYTRLNVVNNNYHFAGSGAQTISSKTYNDVQVSGGSIKTLEGDATINGALTLTDGKVSLSSYNLTIGSSGSITGASYSNYIITSGYLRREGVGSSVDFSFPVGADASSYNPLVINNSGTSDRFDVHVETGISPAHANSSNCLPRTWTIAEGTTGGSNTSIIFQWAGSDENANFTAARTGNRIQAFRHNGSAWVAVGSVGGASGSGTYTFTITGITEFSNFVLGDGNAPLPVELNSFAASSSGKNIILNWQTATEVNNYGFEVLYWFSGNRNFGIVR
ncbi:MAG: hypothetical protein NTX22_18035 [Ignavibacteriales bacterium]|nr:hypothetical protein [Ignavibacteriales bacterium]